MIIGIDFDNTIINYDELFFNQAVDFGWLENHLLTNRKNFSKQKVKETLIEQDGNDHRWQRLQAEVYGKQIVKAKPYQGVIDFIVKVCELGSSVYIVSHKTQFSNFDGVTNLIKPAVEWLEAQNIAGEQGILPTSQVSFHPTRDKKIEKIAKLKCDIFIDDLPEVLLDRNFPSTVFPILFSPSLKLSSASKSLTRTNLWSSIQTFYELLQRESLTWLIELSKLKENLVSSITKLYLGGNNSLRLVSFSDGQKILVKQCVPEKIAILRNEYNALNVLNQYQIKGVAQALSFTAQDCQLIQSYLYGEHVRKINKNHIDQVILFILSLNKLEQKKINYQNFCDYRDCLNGYSVSIEKRWNLIHKDLSILTKTYPVLNKIEKLLEQMCSMKELILEQFEEQIAQYNLNKLASFADNEKIFNPSDFGFHNILEGENKALYFLDFEYFVYDDKAKLVCDFIHNQGHKLSVEQKVYFIKQLDQHGFFTPELKQRISLLINMVGFEWILIILNCAQKDKLQQKIHANADKTVEQIIETQYNKAKEIVECYQANIHKNKEFFSLGIDRRELGFD